jgi:hypothetical protein
MNFGLRYPALNLRREMKLCWQNGKEEDIKMIGVMKRGVQVSTAGKAGVPQ